MSRTKYKTIFVTILVAISSMVAAIGILLLSAWPYVKASLVGHTSQFAASCGCTQYVPFQHHPFIAGITVVLAVLVVMSASIATAKVVTMLRNTAQFKARLQGKVVTTTLNKGIAIHRVADDAPLAVSLGVVQPEVYVSTGLQQLLSPWSFGPSFGMSWIMLNITTLVIGLLSRWYNLFFLLRPVSLPTIIVCKS